MYWGQLILTYEIKDRVYVWSIRSGRKMQKYMYGKYLLVCCHTGFIICMFVSSATGRV